MLKVPSFAYFSDSRVTVYQDDTQFWKFYLIPDYVSIRLDKNGNPVFLLIKYAFGDQDRAEDKTMPRGGGFMVMDVEMRVPEADETKIKAQLQKYVNDTWNQMKELAEHHSTSVQGARLHSWSKLPGQGTSTLDLGVDDVLLGLGPDGPAAPPGDKPPDVVLAQPTWKEGTFTVSAPQSTELVSHRVTEGKVSLTGTNVVSANMDLTPAGATFMQKTLTNLDGGGATDLTPIQVTYNLKFLARVPPVHMLVTADSRSLYESCRSIMHDYDSNGCDDDSISHSDQQLQMAVSSGLVKIQLDAGTLSLSDDFLQQMYKGALDFVMSMIKDSFFDKKPAPAQSTSGQPGDGSDGKPSDPTADFVNRDSDVYYFKSEFDESSMHIGYDETVQSLQDWPINPQGTLQTFLAGVSAAEMKKYVRVVDLDDPFFQTLGLTVTCFADWATEPIAFVECQLRYTGQDENGQNVEKVQTFTFTKDHTSDFWDPSLIGRKREYSYRWRVGFIGHDAGPFSDWKTDTTPKLNFSVADPGKIAIKVLAGNVDWAQVTKQVQVDLSYQDPGSSVAEETTTLVLANGQAEQDYQRYIYTAWDQPVRYRTRHFLKNDQTVESDWQPTLSRQILINDPSSLDKLQVQLVPTGWSDNVIQSVVNVRYQDPVNSYMLEDNRLINGPDKFFSWMVVLKDPKRRKFQYKVLTTYKDGSPAAQTDWIDADGDQTVPIVIRQSPALKVKLLPNLIDFKVTPVVEATLHYDDPQGNVHKVESFPFTDPTPAVWTFPIVDDGRRTYRCSTTFHTADGKTVQLPEVATDETALVLPKLPVPEINCLVVPKLLDLVQTPVVEVDVTYKDPAHDIDYSETLVFTDQNAQSFRVQIADGSPREYQVAVTYYLADGRLAKRDPVTLAQDKIVIPRYLPGT
jgi:hypothetical protein